jgi:hypothetical protein
VYAAWNYLSDSVGVETLGSDWLFHAIFMLRIQKTSGTKIKNDFVKLFKNK